MTADRVHARVEGRIRTGKQCGIGRFPAHDFAINSAWLAASLTAATLLAWLRLLALDGDLAKAEPKTLGTASCTPPSQRPRKQHITGPVEPRLPARQPGRLSYPEPRIKIGNAISTHQLGW